VPWPCTGRPGALALVQSLSTQCCAAAVCPPPQHRRVTTTTGAILASRQSTTAGKHTAGTGHDTSFGGCSRQPRNAQCVSAIHHQQQQQPAPFLSTGWVGLAYPNAASFLLWFVGSVVLGVQHLHLPPTTQHHHHVTQCAAAVFQHEDAGVVIIPPKGCRVGAGY
jgi:hypothetical protein